jgi:hypothetical protein
MCGRRRGQECCKNGDQWLRVEELWWEEVRYGEVSKGVVEEFGDVGVAGSEEGGGEVNAGITVVEFAVKEFAILFADNKSTNCEDILAFVPRSYK